VNNIETDLRETGWGGMNSINLTQDRGQWRALVNTVVNETSGFVKCWEILE
jgi:hypothetical protein